MKKITCERCSQPASTRIMSFFNTDMICKECQLRESEHPQYAEAKRIELEAIKKGNYKFPGIGLPDDLKTKKQKQ